MKCLWSLGLIFCVFLSASETSLGGITLNAAFDDVIGKYPFRQTWFDLERTTLPYPLAIMNKDAIYLAESPKLDIQIYFSINKRVKAIVASLYEKEKGSRYETARGLRLGDTKVEIELLYGTPLAVTEQAFTTKKDGEESILRIYYYPDLCIYTREFAGLPEIVTTITVGEYNFKYIENLRQTPTYEKKKVT